MNINNSRRFIKEPVLNILYDSIVSTISLQDGFNSLAVFDYIFSSVFIKITGCLEQKMKLICWEMATEDLEYRRKLLSDEDNLGECSRYEAKNKIFKSLCKHYFSLTDTTELEIPQTLYLIEIKKEFLSLFSNSHFKNIYPRDYMEWLNIIDEWIKQKKDYKITLLKDSGLSSSLFGEENWDKDTKNQIKLSYNNMIIFRNTVAHNTKSPLKELPTIKTMRQPDFVYENYFIRFTVLILADKIFISLFDKYLKAL
ncbi:MAG: hypothetical protein FWF35_04115 [Elusimicrobia bacterium]|nr:hypothetical protein [Elusimicrobiota bacterium]